MPRHRPIDIVAIDDLLRRSERVVTHSQLVEVGVPLSTICSRIGTPGPWQRLHPGVVLGHTGQPSARELLLGALAYSGDGAVLTGMSALRLHGVRALPRSQDIHVLLPHEQRRQARTGLTIERTRHLPEPLERAGLPVAPVARAVIDACRSLDSLDDVRGVIADVVQTRRCTVAEVEVALGRAARQRTAVPRHVVQEVAAGVRSVAEAKVRVVFSRHGIVQPSWNWSLHTLDGGHVVTPDGWWAEIGAALQIDSMAWHLSPSGYKRTQRLERALSIHDVPFLPIAPSDIFTDELGFVEQVRAFLRRHAEHQPSPELVARPPQSGRERRPA